MMQKALSEAKKAAEIGEVPIGCVIVRERKVIARAHNQRETKKNALLHAEISAIDKACKKLGGWRLWECDLYVTLEPCPMCAGAIINSRIRRVIYAAKDPKAGAMGSILDLTKFPLNHKPELRGGVLEEESSRMLKSFFQTLRKK